MDAQTEKAKTEKIINVKKARTERSCLFSRRIVWDQQTLQVLWQI